MLLTLNELKNYLKITGADEDQRLELIRSAAESEAKRYCKRKFEYGTYIESIEAVKGVIWVAETPVESVTEVETPEGETLTVYRTNSETGEIILEQNYSGPVSITYVGGLQTVPNDLKFAIMRLAEYYYAKTEGVTSESIGELKVNYEAIPAMAIRALDLYRRVSL